MNNKGPNLLPWGTPALIGLTLLLQLSTTTNCFLLLKLLKACLIHIKTFQNLCFYCRFKILSDFDLLKRTWLFEEKSCIFLYSFIRFGGNVTKFTLTPPI